ncbi:MAG: WbqC family protein [Bacteroidales bacterium]|nr:WbqC family protein [Bacteroidales bacterium]MDZ4203361.1 WbqC family protein [Bacteroidales bacterium]
MGKKVILLSTTYLPPISYFAAIAWADMVELEVQETYPKQTYRNRCHIYSPNGLQALSLPINKPYGNHTKTNQVTISNHINWKNIHWRSLEAAYNSSPFFIYYRDQLEADYNRQVESLLEFNHNILKTLLKMIGLNAEICYLDVYTKNPEKVVDLRNAIHPKKPVSQVFKNHEYTQVFAQKHGFLPDLSIVDLLFNVGPAAAGYLQQFANLIPKTY